MKRISAKLKITVWYMLFTAVVTLTVFALMNSANLKSIEHNMSVRITRNVENLARRISTPRRDLKRMPGFEYFSEGVCMGVYNENGECIAGQIPLGINDDLNFEDGKVRTSLYNGSKYYEFDKITHTADGETVWVKGIMSVSDERMAADEAAKRNLVFIIIMILIAGAGGYIIIVRTLMPIKKIRETANTIIKSKDLSQRIRIGAGDDEFHILANTFDEMLDEIEIVFEREKRFTSDASHELRTPVAVIMSECEYMMKYANTVEEFKESAESVQNQTKRMSSLISQLLSISRMDNDTQKLSFEQTNISELAEFICSEQQQIHSDNITLETNIALDIMAQVDAMMISRVFINLISNAYKYNIDNGSIKVSLDAKNGRVYFSVFDTGVGISEEEIPKIWERFYRADKARQSDGSMGLGLSMVKLIAQKHHGEVSVTSEKGKGSEFVFEFPQNADK